MYSKSLIFLLLLLLPLSNCVWGQSLKSYQKAAEKALIEKDYNAALIYLNKALVIEPNSGLLQYQYAEVARNFNAFEIAEEYYLKVLEGDEKQNFPIAHLHLGLVYKSVGQYDLAIINFNNFLNVRSLNKDKKLRDKAKKEIIDCQWATKTSPSDTIQVTQLSKKINSPYSEFGALLSNDTLYYSSFQFINKQDKHQPQRRLTKIVTSIKDAKSRPLSRGFNIEAKHTAHTAFSTNKNRFYFTVCDYYGSAQIRCKIVYREKDKRGRWKKTLVELPASINLSNFTATQPTIAYDSLLQKEVLYFSSDRPGGQGKSDIWYSIIEGKTFGTPINLKEINTSEEELTPFFHIPTQTLYFSSDGHKNRGGYDIFKIKKAQNWGLIENLQSPINTSYNDLYYWLNESSETAYLSSNRLGSFYLDESNKSCCNDLYKVDFLNPLLPETDEPIVLIPNKPPSIPSPPTTPKTPEEPTTLEDFLPLALYFDNDEPDKKTRKTSTKKTYAQSYETYISRKEEYIKEYSFPLKEEQQSEAEINMNAFFNTDITKGYNHLFLFSDILLKRLQKGERVEIFIKGFTSPRAQSDYNVNLGKRRVSSLRNHFSQYAGAVFMPYLSNGQLVITERSFGETTSATNVSDDLDDLRNSIYSISAAKERRVEIVEVKVAD